MLGYDDELMEEKVSLYSGEIDLGVDTAPKREKSAQRRGRSALKGEKPAQRKWQPALKCEEFAQRVWQPAPKCEEFAQRVW